MTGENATCGTCPYWVEVKPLDGRLKLGECHHVANKPVGNSYLDFNWWCSEHPARQRDRLAAIAMGGLVSAWGDTNPADELAEYSYKVADAMLSARRKAKKEKGL